MKSPPVGRRPCSVETRRDNLPTESRQCVSGAALRGRGAERAHRIRNTLNGPVADANFVGDFQNAFASSQMIADALFNGCADARSTLPASTARLSPAWTRWPLPEGQSGNRTAQNTAAGLREASGANRPTSAATDVRYDAHYGLTSDIARGPRRANRRHH
jgi:hypothetical protein